MGMKMREWERERVGGKAVMCRENKWLEVNITEDCKMGVAGENKREKQNWC